MRLTPVYDLPPIDYPHFKQAEEVRATARDSLKDCSILGTNYLDHDRAIQIMRSCAVEDAKIRLNYYRGLPGFIDEWKREICERSVVVILGCFPNFTFEIRYFGLAARDITLPRYEDPRQFLDEIMNTVLRELYPSNEGQNLPDGEVVNDDFTPALRRALLHVYQTKFPHDSSIIEICWAAHQHVREWQRWVSGKLGKQTKAHDAFVRC